MNLAKAKLAEALSFVSGYLFGCKQISMIAGVNKARRLSPVTISVSHTDLEKKLRNYTRTLL